MPSQHSSVGLLDQAEVQHQTIKVCVLGTYCKTAEVVLFSLLALAQIQLLAG